MDQRVDLTENRIFSRKNSIPLINKILSKYRFPWNDCLHIVKTLDIPETELFYTGDRETRRRKKIYLDNFGYECDCCGSQINYLPWKNFLTLCDKCTSAFEVDTTKIPWQKK